MRTTRTRGWVALGVLALALVCSAETAGAEDQRLGTGVRPTFESVRLTVDAAQSDFTGSARIDLLVGEPAESFRFHAQELALDRLVLTSAGGAEIGASHKTGDLGLVTVTPERALAPGVYRLDIDYSASFNKRQVGLYKVESEGRAYTFTQFEADDARRAMPCWDEPAFKIPYQVTLVVPADHVAITNTPVEKETTAAGWRTIVFKKTPPLPSYLLAIATGPFETVEIPGLSIPGRVVTVKDKGRFADMAVRVTPPLLAALEKYFDRPYPYEKLDLIAIPDYWPGAMENPGAITYSEPLLLIDPAQASPAQRRSLARVTAHELAHMWFGDLVTMEWWDDLWLNEAFADWMGDKITDQVFPEYKLHLSELQGGVQATMIGDARPSTQAIRRPVAAADNKLENVGTDYNKGKTILGMFESYVGPERFRAGVNSHLSEHAWGNAKAEDLWAALSKSMGQDIGPAMTTFLDQGGLPLVIVEGLEGDRVRLRQRRFANHGVSMPAQTWRIPITLRYPAGLSTRTQTVMLDEASQTFALGAGAAPAWVMPNADAAGYYRWSVPPAMMRAMSAEAVRLLTPRERIGFVGNLSALLDAGAIHGDEYLKAIGPFADDPEPQVVSAVLGALGKVKVAFVPDESRQLFAHYVRSTLGPTLERFGLARRPDEDETVSIFRPQLIGWLGEEGADEKVLENARSLAKAYMADPASVDPSLAGVALRLSARRGDRELFDEYRRRAESTQVPQERQRYLDALGTFDDPALKEEALKYSLEGKLRPQEIFQVAGGLGYTSKGRDRLFRWMTENYATITSRIPPAFAGFMPFFASGCEAERLAAARTFFAEPAHQAQGTETSLAKVSDQVNDCVALREREAAAVTAYLNQAGASR